MAFSMNDKDMDNNKAEKRWAKIFILLLIVLIFAPIILFSVLDWFVNSDSFSIGITGFIQTVVVRGCLGLLAVIIAFISVIKLIRPDTSFKQKFGRAVIIVLCLVSTFFFVRPLILDIPYLKCPETAYLDRLEFDDEMGVGDNPTRYYLRGVDITGERHSFHVSRKKLTEGRELWTENKYHLYAKVFYLPHTSALMTLEFITELDASAAELYPPSADLPKNWESFSVQINNTVYTLPVPLADFLDAGWKIAEEDDGLYLAGADEPYASYDRQWISLTNDREQTISVMVYNTTEKTISVTESIVGDIHVIYGNYDFAGTELRLPGGLMLGWSTRKDILKLYGQPNESFESTYGAYSLTYQTNDPIDTAYWKLSFDESGILQDIIVHHQAFGRSD